MVRFRGAREKGAMAFVECLGFSQEDTMEGPLWRETLGRILGSHDATELVGGMLLLLLLLLFLTFSVLVANPTKLLYTVANPARGLLNREKRPKEKVWQHTPPPPHPTLLVRRK